MELNTSQPQHSQIIAKPSRNPILLIAVGAVIIIIVALALLVWQKSQEVSSVLVQLADTEKQLVAKTSNSGKNSDKVTQQPAMYTLPEAEQKAAASLAATEYYCLVANFGCDKVTSQVTKFQKVTDSTDGFAIVKAINSEGKSVTPWLKYRTSGTQWIVFYEGEAMPPSAVIKQFDIPTDFLAVN